MNDEFELLFTEYLSGKQNSQILPSMKYDEMIRSLQKSSGVSQNERNVLKRYKATFEDGTWILWHLGDGDSKRMNERKGQRVVRREELFGILDEVHRGLDHPGICSMWKALREYYGISKEIIELYTRCCTACRSKKRGAPVFKSLPEVLRLDEGSDDEMDRVKFAVVRVPESKVIEFFAIIASKGFTDVAFVNSLQQAAFTSLAEEPQPPTGSPSSHHSNGVNGMTILQSSPSPPPAATVSTNNTTPLNLSDLFPAVLGQAGNNRDVSPFGDNGLMTNDNDNDGHGRPYHQRMKGWQRTYLSEMLKEGYPSDDRLHEAMLKCDLSRRQILRFISKRVNNPNKNMRTDWRAARAQDNEKLGTGADLQSIKDGGLPDFFQILPKSEHQSSPTSDSDVPIK